MISIPQPFLRRSGFSNEPSDLARLAAATQLELEALGDILAALEQKGIVTFHAEDGRA